jgi:glycosyltransferase involved in cell wall biosynthesis
MKVLFIHQYSGALGGAETDILLEAGALRDRGHSVALLYEAPTGQSETAWAETFSAGHQTLGENPSETVRNVVNQFVPDVIYFHSLPDIGALRASLNSQVPVVRRVHDHRLYCMRGGKYNYFTRAICSRPASWRCVFPCLGFLGRNPGQTFPFKWISYQDKVEEIRINRQCDCLVVYSQYQKDELIRNNFDPAKIEIQVPVHQDNETGPLSTFSDQNLILFIGQVIRGKGVDLLLRALARVRVPFQARILGEGNHRLYCERLSARLGLTDRVQFHGFIPRGQMQEYFLQASLLAVSSVWPEPFGLVGREAMQYGLPVVAFDAGGIREWLLDGENGFLVPWKDTKRFAARMELLLQDKELARRLGRRGRELVCQQTASPQGCLVEQLLLRVVRARGLKLNYLPLYEPQ